MAPYQTREIMSRNVKRLRKERGWTQPELAEHSGMSLHAISSIERGESDGLISTWLIIAEALGVTLADLIRPAEGRDDVEEKTDY